MIHIYCGNGKGKTTAAAGLAVRMAGHKKQLLFVQFLKGSYTGEIDILERLNGITVTRCDKEYGFFSSLTPQDKNNLIKCHNNNLDYVINNMNHFDMIVLDEIFAAYNYQLADKEKIKYITETYKGELVLTGREPNKWFMEKADYISEIKKIKHPFDIGIGAREGIEY